MRLKREDAEALDDNVFLDGAWVGRILLADEEAGLVITDQGETEEMEMGGPGEPWGKRLWGRVEIRRIERRQ